MDWWNLLFNALWVAALALALAAVSAAGWRASVQKTRLNDELARPGAGRTLMISGVLFCAGLALTSASWWERLAWGLFAGYFAAVLAGMLIRRTR